MEQLPKIVAQRLAATAKPGTHPDPDLLTAFAEHSLGERERAPVLEHLAHCSDCREVVSLAQPEPELAYAAAAAPKYAAAAAPPPALVSWFRRPVVRWAAAVACVVVVGSAVVLRREGKPATYASKSLPVVAVLNQSPAEPQPAPAEPEGLRDEAKAKPANESLAKEAASRADEERQKSSGLTVRKKSIAEPTFAVSSGTGMGAAPALRAAPAPPPPPAVEAEGRVLDKLASKPEASGSIASRDAPAPAAKSVGDVAGGAIAQEKVEVAITPETEIGSKDDKKTVNLPRAQASSEQSDRVAIARSAAAGAAVATIGNNYIAPRWSLSPDGLTVLRSFDEGKTWRAIPVSDKPTVFRALASLGPEVWVGGAAGLLYHSSDLGQHWRQVKPAAGKNALTDDIVHLDLTDDRHLQITTRSNTFWTTHDQGAHWQVK